MPSQKTVRNALAIVLTFVGLGPMIGLVVVALGFSSATLSPPIFVFLLLYGVIFAHLMGALPALISGAMVAGYAGVRGRVPDWFALLAGVAGLLGIHDVEGLLNPHDAQFGWGVTIVIPLSCVIAAIACTRLTRRWQARAGAVAVAPAGF